jgi:hypothetical protein
MGGGKTEIDGYDIGIVDLAGNVTLSISRSPP